jgi:cytochrome d ubiquinol oxidase subunit I
MKLAAMEGLYHGHKGQSIVGAGVLNPNKAWNNTEDEYLFDVSVPYGLSILARHDYNAFVPGIADIINGVDIAENGDTINTVSYEERIRMGKLSHVYLRNYDAARADGDTVAMNAALVEFQKNYKYFGYGYFDSVEEAIPPIPMTFYAFHVMVIGGSFLFAFLIFVLFAVYKKQWLQKSKLLQWLGMACLVIVYVVSQSGWIVAEVGRQPWTVQDLLPARAAISGISASTVMTTFWIFVVIFTSLLIAEMSIMCKQISKGSKSNLENSNN